MRNLTSCSTRQGSIGSQAADRLLHEGAGNFQARAPWITMAHSRIYIPLRKEVEGFVMNPNGSFGFEDVRLR
jgi:hypothetical protein